MTSGYDKAICSVMIYSYKGLEKRCDLIDKNIYNTAVRSAFRNTVEVYKEIEQLTREKIAYINVKVIIDQSLATLKCRYEITQHHIKGEGIEQIATTLNVKRKIIDKRLQRQRTKLYEAILNTYSAEELLNIIYDSDWLMNRYKSELKQQQGKIYAPPRGRQAVPK